MTFKNNWETTDQQFQISAQTIKAMVALALPKAKVASHKIISAGCANLNIKINLVNELHPFILRIYIRDKGAAFREQKLAALIKPSVPIPEIYFVGDEDDFRFAITEYMPGVSLRDLLLKHSKNNIQNIMYQAGQILASIQMYQFPKAGFFDADLKVSQPLTKQSYITFARECLTHSTVLEKMGEETVDKITSLLEKHGSLFPDENQTHLVHADYDPANILVDKIEGQWKVTAILDWEFAHSGSTLSDIANMLRYAHHMPPIFEDSFLQGLQQSGVILPENWRYRIDLLNLLSLLNCLVRCSPKEHPNRCADICDLISNILSNLQSRS
ncbi:MAG: phosphotransferase [Alphaproteobacteria bacterium]|jgi:aminoglycoside phosphotransferase (APT) family kinase protein|nr:phosphotransferase [Alphaproteobacteria bacterium]MBP7729763.1 phosphotransferase [Alphaproteobacteria bacterium]